MMVWKGGGRGMAGVNKVAEGVYRIRIKGPIGDVGHVNLYLIEGGDEATLVDAGFFSSADEILDAVETVLGPGFRINRIIITHLHYDHYGSASQLAARLSTEVLLHEREKIIAKIIEDIRLDKERTLVKLLQLPERVAEKVYKVIRREVEIYPKHVKEIEGDTVIRSKSGRWRPIHTPGHTPGHLCLFNEEAGVLISGDHLLPSETSNIAYYPIKDYNPLLEFLQSLKLVEKLNPKLLLPSHGDAFTDASRRVSFLFQHHEKRLQEVMQGIMEEKSITGAARHVKWSRGDFENLSDFDKWLAVLETLSHAEFLAYCGVAERRIDKTLTYSIVDSSFEKVLEKLHAIR